MKILLFGKTGQVGWELQRSLATLGDVVALSSKSQEFCGDFTNLTGLASTVQAIAPDIIINAAAFTAVDQCEQDVELANLINVKAPTRLAEEAKKLKALFVHYSTDYVFDGSGNQPWMEGDVTNPLGVYAQTKLDAEKNIEAIGGDYLIFRTSWVYAPRGRNFAKTMIHLAQERDALSVVSDQIGAPTSAELIADVTAIAVRKTLDNLAHCGIYHLVADGYVSWHGFAAYVLDYCRQRGMQFKVLPDHVKAVTTAEYPTPAKRPLNSRLNTQKLKQTFNIYLPHWHVGVGRMLEEFLERRK